MQVFPPSPKQEGKVSGDASLLALKSGITIAQTLLKGWIRPS